MLRSRRAAIARTRVQVAAAFAVAVTVALSGGAVTTASTAHVSPDLGYLWVYPSSCPLKTDLTLQDCIDDAHAGDAISINAGDMGNVGLHLDKSLTLFAGPGYHPKAASLIVGGASVSAPIQATVRGLTLSEFVLAVFDASGSSNLTLDHVQAHSVAGVPGIDVTGSGNFELTVTSSRVFANNFQDDGVEVRVNGSGIASASFVGNTVTGSNLLTVGIGVEAWDTARMHANVMNNVVAGFGGCNCGQASGLDVYVTGSALMTANLVGNTVDRTRSTGNSVSAVQIDNEGDAASQVTANVFDNILARSSGPAIRAYHRPAAPLVVRSGNNDLWANDGGDAAGASAGTGNLHLNPQFIDPPYLDYRLQPGSPLVDRGIVCSPGGVAMLDAAGHARLHGPSVDLGAFERGSVAPTGTAVVGGPSDDALVGSAGDDILCGLGGTDVLQGKGGNDDLDGGTGDDRLYGGPGSDRLFGRAGNDRLCASDGTHGNDTADGGPGTDKATTDPADVRVSIEGTATAC